MRNLWAPVVFSLTCAYNAVTPGLANFFWKGPYRKYFRLWGPFSLSQLLSSVPEAHKQLSTIPNDGYCYILIKPCSQKQVAGWNWPVGHGVTTPVIAY